MGLGNPIRRQHRCPPTAHPQEPASAAAPPPPSPPEPKRPSPSLPAPTAHRLRPLDRRPPNAPVLRNRRSLRRLRRTLGPSHLRRPPPPLPPPGRLGRRLGHSSA